MCLAQENGVSLKVLVEGLLRQLRTGWKLLLLFNIPALIALAASSIFLLFNLTPDARLFFRDIAAIGGLPFYAGIFSQISGLVWCSTAAVCFFAFFSYKKTGIISRQGRRLLFWAAVLTTVLMLDDVFLFHESIAPVYLGIRQRYVYAGYLAFILWFMVWNWREIVSGEYALFTVALSFFGASVFLDIIPESLYKENFVWVQLEVILEDSLKLAGNLTWLAFFVRYAYFRLRKYTSVAVIP